MAALGMGASKAGRASAARLGTRMGTGAGWGRAEGRSAEEGRREKLKPSGELPRVKQGMRQLHIPGGLGMQAGMLWSGICPLLPWKVDSGQQHGISCSLLAKWARQGQRACRVQV